MHYATLTQVRRYLRISAAEDGDDEMLIDFINQSVRAIDEYSRRRFDVVLETRSFDYPFSITERTGIYDIESFVYEMNRVSDWVNRKLVLDEDLLEVTELLNGNGVEIAAANFILEPNNTYPKHTVKLRRESSVGWQTGTNGATEQIIDISGYWGYHTRYTDAFVDTLDTVQDNPLTNSATTITVTDADGTASDIASPRFQAGQMLKIESEFVFVVDVDIVANEITVTRGYNGTTAAEHAQTTVIYVYRPMGDIVLAAQRAIAHAYRLKDSDIDSVQHIIGTGVQITPEALPATVRQLLPPPKPPRISADVRR